MPGLDDLPDELLSRICDQLLSLVRKNHELGSVARVNKRLYQIVLPLLWRDVHVIDRRHLHRKLCAALVLGENIATLVQTIRIDTTDPEDQGRGYASKEEALSKERGLKNEEVVDRLAARAVAIFGHGEQCSRWQTGIERQDTEFMIALLLAHLPNLRRLRMTHDDQLGVWKNLDVISKHMLQDERLSVDEKPFQRIREVYIAGEFDNHAVNPLPLFLAATWPALESVRAICAGNNEGDEAQPAFTKLAPKSLDLSTIQLFPSCHLLDEHLQGLVGASRNLCTFQYHLGLGWAWIPINVRAIQKTLNAHDQILTDLTLCLNTIKLEHLDEGDTFYPMDFARFSRLTHLCIGAAFLYDREAGPLPSDRLVKSLPTRITTLRIVHVEDEIELQHLGRCIVELFQHKSRFPDLEVFEVGVLEDGMNRKKYKKCRTSIESVGARAGQPIRFFAYTEPEGVRGSLLSQIGALEEDLSDESSVLSFEDYSEDDGWSTEEEGSELDEGQDGESRDGDGKDDDDDDDDDDDESQGGGESGEDARSASELSDDDSDADSATESEA